jgi:CHASE2 domain-containing sensor protein
MGTFHDAFISYGRADSKGFAQKLNDRLLALGYDVWFDFEDIPLGVDFQNQIDKGIEQTHTFLFIISPHSVNSPYCAKELALALHFKKRIIPLMHVETINYETWQARHPQETKTDWARYQAAGLHSSYPNLHPDIGKINWIFCREAQDDFEQAFQGLVSILERQKDYVHQHTYWLERALLWERYQRQNAYLLVDEERHQASQWLATRFLQAQPPCEPSLLHIELIAESTQHADNGMTHVFLSYAQENHAFKDATRQRLLREGSTVWTNLTDIHSGINFKTAIAQGIEEADNFVFLLSPESIQSAFCLQELDWALSLNKRLIPVLIAEVDWQQVPHRLRAVQSIHYQADLSELIKVLRQDAPYYRQHKRLLIKALKWERQQQNPNILLRGQELSQSLAWRQVAQIHPHHPPTASQLAFLQASADQPPQQTLGAFICHASADLDFARKLNDTLQIQGKSTWFAGDDLAQTDDGSPARSQSEANAQEAEAALAQAENVLFVASKVSLASSLCLNWLATAAQLKKRIILVVYRAIGSEALPDPLQGVPIVNFRQHEGDFLVNFGELFRLIESHPVHVKTHTRLLVKAQEWEQANQDDSLLLRGTDLAASQTWLQQAGHKMPAVTTLQQTYIQASQALLSRRIKLRSALLMGGLATLVTGIVRLLGGLQPLELGAYDAFLRLKPSEAQDQRLLMVLVDESSGGRLRGEFAPGLGTIADPALVKVLDNLRQHQPRLVALDFYRDFSTQPDLAQRFQGLESVIGICKGSGVSDQRMRSQGVPKPAEIPIERIGFVDFLNDGNRMLRRQYLMKQADAEFCPTRTSLSLLLAQQFLATENQAWVSPWDEQGNFVQEMRLGTRLIPQLWGDGSGYRDRNAQLGGYQILLNFRTHQGDPNAFATVVTLESVLDNQVAPDLIRDRIVLIGYTDPTDRNADQWNTPYGPMPGVMLQGQMTSQLIAAVLDNRPLIWWWPMAGEMIWILGWASASAVSLWAARPGWSVAISIGNGVVLVGSCYLIWLWASGWVPLMPAMVAIILSSGSVGWLTWRIRNPK